MDNHQAIPSPNILRVLSLFCVLGFVAGTTVCTSKSCSPSDALAHPGLTGLQLRNAMIAVTTNEAVRAQGLISSMDTSSFDQRTKSAWYDCVELYEDTVLLLKQSAGSNSPGDSQTWLSAAVTNQETCKDGFKDLNVVGNLESHFPGILGNFSKLLGMSLAINKETFSGSHPPPSRIPANLVRGRRLLGNNGGGRDGFPSWLTAGDRKLLQTNSAPAADIVVAKDGSGDYKTISEAVAAAGGGGKRFVIYVKAGVYAENVVVTRTTKNLMLVGDGIDATIVTGNKNAEGGSTTFRSATFAVTGGGFIARGITFENTAGPAKHQAVALRSAGKFTVGKFLIGDAWIPSTGVPYSTAL
ncbi:hypothetical protein MLD38_011361 [Melastoma candidum]|uniref:Uncharacterized protein n=1 Tax=Melastoma candidum TaxID=119954 RepID=A0ACB9R3X4_9MYRT|nr:hypothetical protein MLD38_011361 [Melastoma candidum]